MLSYSLSTLVALASVVLSAPLDVFVPPILSPNAATVWTAGAVETVTWDASNPPAHISNGAAVILRKADSDLDEILASGFDLLTGEVDVTVPADTVAGNDYSIILLGDSGNVSPKFTINAA